MKPLVKAFSVSNALIAPFTIFRDFVHATVGAFKDAFSHAYRLRGLTFPCLPEHFKPKNGSSSVPLKWLELTVFQTFGMGKSEG